MKNKLTLIALALLLTTAGCQESDFEKAYTDPSKIAQTSVEKQFTGFMHANREYVIPSYWHYFVVLRPTINRFTQSVGWVTTENQYVPGGSLTGDRWANYYNFLAQYRELEKVFNSQTEATKTDYRIYTIASTVYLYDHTQKVVDLHGDIPFSEAGMLSTNGGDYTKSYPKYDKAEDIYTKMLNDLKSYADEMSTINVKAAVLAGFRTQDLVNKGDLMLWRKYINSLRVRMLTRVSGSSAFSARAKSEIAEILANPGKYPLVTTNADNIQISIFNVSTDINSSGFRTGLEDWNGNVAGKAMIDHMKTNADPRLRVLFEPGLNANGAYSGLDPLATAAVQDATIAAQTVSLYNRSTLSRNRFFPGMLINSAEVHLMLAEYQLTNGNDAVAKTHYETAIKHSTEFYYNVRSISDDNTVAAPAAATAAEIESYLAAADISWDTATTPAQKLHRIASQRWLHFNVVQPYENWADMRRLKNMNLTFWEDQSNNQKLPPARFLYPNSEVTFNLQNYEAVRANDQLAKKLFWDVK
ncbi:SusD/RagB family nutrient-binding outer membrane lipoprotein [Arundinibacter roseus]|uniref:SusD/RagB family nutrient-binding outer membrane lipoprotein n=1 Tax=Arundinibacter roseus TaxID=2070510 RepID=A0A4R4K8W5_9BACT|nr:SusD/RagB family nutrient-binding outer membrane lipoprotein [Arundinibacter roseus]TDB64197.1 SusD/RagB family nutrient-binding outer membrane lipoprotein [Arundinibacter roseus]